MEVGLRKMVENETGRIRQGFVPQCDPTQISSQPPNVISDSALIALKPIRHCPALIRPRCPAPARYTRSAWEDSAGAKRQ